MKGEMLKMILSKRNLTSRITIRRNLIKLLEPMKKPNLKKKMNLKLSGRAKRPKYKN
jgi:hypothetical protein